MVRSETIHVHRDISTGYLGRDPTLKTDPTYVCSFDTAAGTIYCMWTKQRRILRNKKVVKVTVMSKHERKISFRFIGNQGFNIVQEKKCSHPNEAEAFDCERYGESRQAIVDASCFHALELHRKSENPLFPWSMDVIQDGNIKTPLFEQCIENGFNHLTIIWE